VNYARLRNQAGIFVVESIDNNLAWAFLVETAFAL
jgi:hypothetical protein